MLRTFVPFAKHAPRRLLGASASLGVSILVLGATLPGPAFAAESGSAAAQAQAPRHWNVAAGAQSRDQAIQANAFLPRDVWVDVGDSITWTVPSAEFHTVTFLSGAPEPPFIVPADGGIGINPQVGAPSGGSTYKGSGYFNSGVLNQGQQYTLDFGASGDFSYLCVIHREMKGTVHVRPTGTPYPLTQQNYDQLATAERAALLADGTGLAARGLFGALSSGRDAVTAGIGKFIPNVATLAVMRFEPDRRVVHVGDTVTWTNKDPETPHTVTFGTEPEGGPFATFAPSGSLVGPGHGSLGAPGQSVNSGFIGADMPFGTQFQVTFTAPGVYPYICALHDEMGMVGTIEVVR